MQREADLSESYVIEVFLPQRGYYGFSHMWIEKRCYILFNINCFVHFISSMYVVISHLSDIVGTWMV